VKQILSLQLSIYLSFLFFFNYSIHELYLSSLLSSFFFEPTPHPDLRKYAIDAKYLSLRIIAFCQP